jgi:hypothetical protein
MKTRTSYYDAHSCLQGKIVIPAVGSYLGVDPVTIGGTTYNEMTIRDDYPVPAFFTVVHGDTNWSERIAFYIGDAKFFDFQYPIKVSVVCHQDAVLNTGSKQWGVRMLVQPVFCCKPGSKGSPATGGTAYYESDLIEMSFVMSSSQVMLSPCITLSQGEISVNPDRLVISLEIYHQDVLAPTPRYNIQGISGMEITYVPK